MSVSDLVMRRFMVIVLKYILSQTMNNVLWKEIAELLKEIAP